MKRIAKFGAETFALSGLGGCHVTRRVVAAPNAASSSERGNCREQSIDDFLVVQRPQGTGAVYVLCDIDQRQPHAISVQICSRSVKRLGLDTRVSAVDESILSLDREASLSSHQGFALVAGMGVSALARLTIEVPCAANRRYRPLSAATLHAELIPSNAGPATRWGGAQECVTSPNVRGAKPSNGVTPPQ